MHDKEQQQEKGIIPQEAVDEFKQLYFEEYGVMLSDADATDKATKVLNFVKLLTMPPIEIHEEK